MSDMRTQVDPEEDPPDEDQDEAPPAMVRAIALACAALSVSGSQYVYTSRDVASRAIRFEHYLLTGEHTPE